jgi:hypothetical protein
MVGGHDRHALSMQPAALNVGAMDAQQGGGRSAQEAAEGLSLPADAG